MPTTRTAPRRATTADPHVERASALILVPTLFLVMMSLGAIAVDMSLVHGAHRSLHRTVSVAADDAASMIDRAELQTTGELRVDPRSARAVALAGIEAATLPGELAGPVLVTVSEDGAAVVVETAVRVDHVMLGAVPGAPADQVIHVRASARLNR